MPTIMAEIAAGIAAAITLYNDTFEWQGTNYPCVRRDESAGRTLHPDGGGFIEEVSGYIVVAKSSFPNFAQGQHPKRLQAVDKNKFQIKEIKGDRDTNSTILVLYIGSFDE